MSTPFLLIDGYNLMHAVGIARSTYGPGELEQRRTQFLKTLVGHLTDDQRSRTMVVFDAGNAPQDLSRRQVMAGMDVVFAPPGGDADTVIEEVIAAHSAPKRLRVVSSDHRLQKAARRRRAAFVDSEDFAAELDRRGPVSRQDQRASRRGQVEHPKYTGKTSAKETAHWLDVFGDAADGVEVSEEADAAGGSGVPDGAGRRDRPAGGPDSTYDLDKLQAEIDKLIEEADEPTDDLS